MDLVGFLYGFGVLQGLILALILFTASSSHRAANSLMGGLVLVIALNLLGSWLVRTGYFHQHPTFAMLIPPLDFTWGPLLYLYATALSQGQIKKQQLLHFLPALLILVFANLSFAGNNLEEKQAFISYLYSRRTDGQLEQVFLDIAPLFWQLWVDLHLHSSFFVLQFGIYCALVLKLISEHNRRLQHHFSSTEDMNLRWLRHLTIVCLVFLVIFLLFNRGQLLLEGHFDVNDPGPSTPSVFLVLLVYLIGLRAIFQSDLVRGVLAARESEPHQPSVETAPERPAIEAGEETGPESSQEPPALQKEKYARSSISTEEANRFKIQLMQAIEEEKLYLNSELTLPDLAREAGMKPHQVSQLLNGQMNQNFFSFVNNYRIQLAKKLMSDPETRDMPIVELAVEVGFKSKSSFYDAFKKATQMTPTQFKKSLGQ